MRFTRSVWRWPRLDSSPFPNLLRHISSTPRRGPRPSLRAPRLGSRTGGRRLKSTEPEPNPKNPNPNLTPSNTTNNSSASTSSTSTSTSSAKETARRTRLTRILDGALRWTPRRLRPHAERLRAAPVSHVAAFLALHEATAVVPLLGLVALFKWAGWTPTAFVLGPWAEWAQEGLRTYGSWLRRKGWFGLSEREGRDGEVSFEGEIDVVVAWVRGGGEVGSSSSSSWWRLGRGKKGGVVVVDGGESGEEVSDDDDDDVPGKTGRAWRKVKEVVTLGNMETGYNTGIQIAAAYTITKALFPVRIAISLWATPWGARVLSAVWKAMRWRRS